MFRGRIWPTGHSLRAPVGHSLRIPELTHKIFTLPVWKQFQNFPQGRMDYNQPNWNFLRHLDIFQFNINIFVYIYILTSQK